jgi:hypothetical protein
MNRVVSDGCISIARKCALIELCDQQLGGEGKQPGKRDASACIPEESGFGPAGLQEARLANLDFWLSPQNWAKLKAVKLCTTYF